MLLITAVALFLNAESPDLYELSYEVTGNAKGTILLIFPYRVYYTSYASLILSTRRSGNGDLLYTLERVGNTGYMMRTLGFSGRSLGIITAGRNKSRGKIRCGELKKEFSENSAEYYKYIRKTYWNHFRFNRVKGKLQFRRDPSGIQKKLKSHLRLTRTPGEKPLKISFNIYRILGEVIKSADYPTLPSGQGIHDLITGGRMQWKSGNIDYSEFLARSALYAAGIFRKIRRLKQEKPFRAGFSSHLSGNNILIIRGQAEPEVSIFGSFRIKKFIREIRFSTVDHKLISDRLIIEVRNKSGKGGRFITTLKKMNTGLK